MEIYNEKPIVEINWDGFDDGHFETFPPTIYYESGSDSDENCPDEVELIALVKSNGKVVGITSEGDTVNNVHELQDWDPELVFEYLEDNGYTGFKYYSDTNELRNQVMKPIGDDSGLLSGDYEKIPWSGVRSYMIEELIEQWRYMTPNSSWDVIRLYAELEFHWDDNCIPFHLKRNGSTCWIHNDNNVVIAIQDADDPSRDYVLLKDENGNLARSSWWDMTDDGFSSHMKSWSEFGVKSVIRDARDDDPAPKCEDDLEESDTKAEASKPSWFVCYEVTRYYDCCSPDKSLYDVEFEFRPETESLVDLKKRLADYQNKQDKGMMQKNPLTEKCITIINLTKLTEV